MEEWGFGDGFSKEGVFVMSDTVRWEWTAHGGARGLILSIGKSRCWGPRRKGHFKIEKRLLANFDIAVAFWSSSWLGKYPSNLKAEVVFVCLFLHSTCPLQFGTFIFKTFSVTIAGRRLDQPWAGEEAVLQICVVRWQASGVSRGPQRRLGSQPGDAPSAVTALKQSQCLFGL